MSDKNPHRLAACFDQIAPRYTLMNSLLSLTLDRLWRRVLVEKASVSPHEKILDIACGTGDVLELIEENYPQALVFGLDVSFGMLRQTANAQPGSSLVLADALNSPFLSGSFDLLTIAFGFRNMPDYKRFLQEALRLLKPGGRLLILELTQPERWWMRFANTLYLHSALPFWSWVFARDPQAYAYLRNSIKEFPSQPEVLEMLRDATFVKPEYKLLNLGVATIFQASKKQEES
jgi:demethylmenaquinone methyltransferase / 2-methoxy-6-polyprenyl-1,4-benzoquinol methylase